MKKLSKNRGFTLIEILVVIGIIALLAAIVIIAINPARQFAQARNSQRTSNVETILNAIGQNLADNKGITNCVGITSASTTIGTTGANLAACLVPTYIPSQIPMDPTNGTPGNTGYTISVDSNGRYTVCDPTIEPSIGNPMICVTR